MQDSRAPRLLLHSSPKGLEVMSVLGHIITVFCVSYSVYLNAPLKYEHDY